MILFEIQINILFFSLLFQLFGISIFALCLWICIEPGFNEWIKMLELQKYYIGIYIILIASLGIMVVAFLGCGASLMENVLLLWGVSIYKKFTDFTNNNPSCYAIVPNKIQRKSSYLY